MMPAETHPDAMIAWYMALYTLHSILGNSDIAMKHLELAHDINPDHPAVEQACDELGLYDDEY
jgi:protein-tyrosine phosphatase